MKKIALKVNRIIGIGFISIIVGMMLVCLSKPQHNLIPYQITVDTLIMACLFFTIYVVFYQLEKKAKFLFSDPAFAIIAVFFGIILFFVGITCRNSPVSFMDYEICYRSAIEYATSGIITDGMYFSLNPHNWKCVMVLSGIMKIGYSIGMEDPYYLLLIFNIFLIEAALFSCKYLVYNLFPGRNVNGLMLLLVFGSCLPLYAYAQAFYTDSASFSFSITGISLFHRGYMNSNSKKFSIISYFFAGLLIGIGASMKITGIICVIAVLLACLLSIKNSSSLKKLLIAMTMVFVGVCLLGLSLERLSMKCEWYRDKELFSHPILAYVAMGLKNDGTYYENREFRSNLEDIRYTVDKDEFVKEYITENISDFWNIEHIISKIRANYASGNLGAEDFARYSYGEDNVLNSMFNWYGNLYWYACKYNMSWIFQIYLILTIGGIIALLKGNEKPLFGISVVELTFLGYFIFLFFWEANNRQLFNMLPILLTGYVISLNLIYDSITMKKINSEEDR